MYDFVCKWCKKELHLAPAYDKHKMADRALELLGWQRNCCPDCLKNREVKNES